MHVSSQVSDAIKNHRLARQFMWLIDADRGYLSELREDGVIIAPAFFWPEVKE